MTERRRVLRRPAVRPSKPAPIIKSKGRTGMVPPGTKGIYDSNPKVRSATARAMVARRQMVEVVCQADGCIDPSTGEPKRFMSRLINGEPERRGCSPAHRLKIWRKEMRERGYRQVTVDGSIGWLTPEGVFYPNPTQPAKRNRSMQPTLRTQAAKLERPSRRFRKVRKLQKKLMTGVTPGSR